MERRPITTATAPTTPSPQPAETNAEARVELVHAMGMHARPAVKLTRTAKRYGARIVLRVAGTVGWIDAKSVAKVVAMRAPCGCIIEFRAVGADAGAAIGALTALVANDFVDTEG